MKKLSLPWKIIIGICFTFFLINCTQTQTYTCDVCKMSFEDKKWADKCENWCETQHSCNAEITKHAIK